jgi:hypothetical protein
MNIVIAFIIWGIVSVLLGFSLGRLLGKKTPNPCESCVLLVNPPNYL